MRVLNRVFRWSGAGLFLEADPRHQEIVVVNERGQPTASIKEQVLSPSAEQKLTDTEANVFRSDAARSNYLGLDRVDIAYPAKELCRGMSAPDRTSKLALQRALR